MRFCLCILRVTLLKVIVLSRFNDEIYNIKIKVYPTSFTVFSGDIKNIIIKKAL